uniref:Uncharacterized protein n=1 Tax=Fopius arisanus TaxID=64838 RepID=A0A0C9QW96_9HYME
MFSNRELRVILKDHRKFGSSPFVSAPNKIEVHQLQKLHSPLSKFSEESKEPKPKKLKNPLFKMRKKTPEPVTSKRQTRASRGTKPPPITLDDPEPRKRKKGKPKRPPNMKIKSENALRIKKKILNNLTTSEENNNVEPSKKRPKRNSIIVIDPEDPEIVEIKEENTTVEKSTVNSPDMMINSTCSNTQLNDSSFNVSVSGMKSAVVPKTVNNSTQSRNNEQEKNISTTPTREYHSNHVDVQDTIKELIDIFKVYKSGGVYNKKTDPQLPEGEGSSQMLVKNSSESIQTGGDTDDPREKKMKCLNEIISDVFDLKLPEIEERNYVLLKQVLEEYKREKKSKFAKSEAQKKKYEKAVSRNLQGIKLILKKMNRRQKMVDKGTQTSGEPLEELKDPEVDPVPDANPTEEGTVVANTEPPEEIQQASDVPAGDLAGMIILDSVDSSNDHQGSVFQRLGYRTEESSGAVAKEVHSLVENPENPSPCPLSLVELQREMIERHHKGCNIVMTGFRSSWKRLEDDINEFIWRIMGVNAEVNKVLVVGNTLVVTVGSHIIKKQILRNRWYARLTQVRIVSDYTGREKKVQQFLEAEEKLRNKAGGKVKAAYGKIRIDGVWWHWDELEGRLTRSPFRPDLGALDKVFAMD